MPNKNGKPSKNILVLADVSEKLGEIHLGDKVYEVVAPTYHDYAAVLQWAGTATKLQGEMELIQGADKGKIDAEAFEEVAAAIGQLGDGVDRIITAMVPDMAKDGMLDRLSSAHRRAVFDHCQQLMNTYDPKPKASGGRKSSKGKRRRASQKAS